MILDFQTYVVGGGAITEGVIGGGVCITPEIGAKGTGEFVAG